jgi:hypothetical protein
VNLVTVVAQEHLQSQDGVSIVIGDDDAKRSLCRRRAELSVWRLLSVVADHGYRVCAETGGG